MKGNDQIKAIKYKIFKNRNFTDVDHKLHCVSAMQLLELIEGMLQVRRGMFQKRPRCISLLAFAHAKS